MQLSCSNIIRIGMWVSSRVRKTSQSSSVDLSLQRNQTQPFSTEWSICAPLQKSMMRVFQELGKDIKHL